MCDGDDDGSESESESELEWLFSERRRGSTPWPGNGMRIDHPSARGSWRNPAPKNYLSMGVLHFNNFFTLLFLKNIRTPHNNSTKKALQLAESEVVGAICHPARILHNMLIFPCKSCGRFVSWYSSHLLILLTTKLHSNSI